MMRNCTPLMLSTSRWCRGWCRDLADDGALSLSRALSRVDFHKRWAPGYDRVDAVFDDVAEFEGLNVGE